MRSCLAVSRENEIIDIVLTLMYLQSYDKFDKLRCMVLNQSEKSRTVRLNINRN